jgi:hypothetical protein
MFVRVERCMSGDAGATMGNPSFHASDAGTATLRSGGTALRHAAAPRRPEDGTRRSSPALLAAEPADEVWAPTIAPVRLLWSVRIDAAQPRAVTSTMPPSLAAALSKV